MFRSVMMSVTLLDFELFILHSVEKWTQMKEVKVK
jgi:hypothetical protein